MQICYSFLSGIQDISNPFEDKWQEVFPFIGCQCALTDLETSAPGETIISFPV
ncbi:hypothetical protein Cflav_PD3213 [Pedosphaera parvula Ellin514]|uniref:Uncharacterized protein n=1 Tax=Pedosphaera parvula (strain Ellin514) TaxID=320771 RepID=B9XJB6_PEDPL|nr:hypothetical protein Cflav_PD3213 [Pedosphaera parvula Ellin514]